MYHPTGNDVISYFRSRVSRHFVRFFTNFSIRYLKIGSTQIHQIWSIDWQRCFLCILHACNLSINPFQWNNAITFLDTHAYISETTQHILTKFCMLIPSSLVIIVAEVYVNISKPFRNTRLSRKLLSLEWPSSLTLRTTVITCAVLHFVLIRWFGIGHVWNFTIKWHSRIIHRYEMWTALYLAALGACCTVPMCMW